MRGINLDTKKSASLASGHVNRPRRLAVGWGAGIRTPEVTESESVALPLGDTPVNGVFIFAVTHSAFIL